jgi:hypothetical protein
LHCFYIEFIVKKNQIIVLHLFQNLVPLAVIVIVIVTYFWKKRKLKPLLEMLLDVNQQMRFRASLRKDGYPVTRQSLV